MLLFLKMRGFDLLTQSRSPLPPRAPETSSTPAAPAKPLTLSVPAPSSTPRASAGRGDGPAGLAPPLLEGIGGDAEQTVKNSHDQIQLGG